ncbi:Tho complex subunit 7-domain-containing protein [Astrocystis sublimbata]|nr:Tho complex subunit 7-domain-containing protein [Astrocystis sublimbata]
MASSQFGLLDEREETELHKTRLLNVEERPFKRLTKRLVTPGSFTNPIRKALTPPPEKQNGDADPAADPDVDVAVLKEDILLDFAAFDSAIVRLQFLATANAAERERYTADRLEILGTMDQVRDGNTQLRVRLDEARATREQRRKFDELADKITGNRMLRTRAEQHVNLEKLAEECEELRRESEAYGDTWRERREQFERLVDEGRRLRALIRDEKEEVERREGMDSDAEDGEAAPTPGKGIASGNVTPLPNNGNGASGRGDAGNATPRHDGGRDEPTPRPDSPGAAATGGEGSKRTKLDASGSFSRASSLTPGVAAGGLQGSDKGQENSGDDVETSEIAAQRQQSQNGDTPMAEETPNAPQITIDAPAGSDEDKMDTT